MTDTTTPEPLSPTENDCAPGVLPTPRGAVGPEDVRLVERFLAGTLPAEAFGHRQHLRVAWGLLCSYPLEAAIGRFTTGLRRFAAAHGKPDLVHETVTWALLLLIHGRIATMEPQHTFEALLERYPELLDGRGLLRRHYREETLTREQARRTFVFPDRHLEVVP